MHFLYSFLVGKKSFAAGMASICDDHYSLSHSCLLVCTPLLLICMIVRRNMIEDGLTFGVTACAFFVT